MVDTDHSGLLTIRSRVLQNLHLRAQAEEWGEYYLFELAPPEDAHDGVVHHFSVYGYQKNEHVTETERNVDFLLNSDILPLDGLMKLIGLENGELSSFIQEDDLTSGKAIQQKEALAAKRKLLSDAYVLANRWRDLGEPDYLLYEKIVMAISP